MKKYITLSEKDYRELLIYKKSYLEKRYIHVITHPFGGDNFIYSLTQEETIKSLIKEVNKTNEAYKKLKNRSFFKRLFNIIDYPYAETNS